MMNIKLLSISCLILGLCFVRTVECEEFDIKEARSLVNGIFKAIKRTLGNNLSYESKIKQAKNAVDLPRIADNDVLNEDQLYGLQHMAQANRNDLIGKINTFETSYNNLLTKSNNSDKTVPFQSLKEKLANGGQTGEDDGNKSE